ncbi:succinate dehydrogenase, cytochrome b556 subunit [Paracoccus sp. IB05]|uniref:succinate dehydrogenase, cytochrome b556 subunit n=1 Tax=Paracoccus sp. IB05 TaxID=2779367 RepID=UPI0018E74D1A|nr:succinate dehydrogenase, cytochrome b556 subunit [Paracoccus sp. IB05]MBJ2150445.1 succinate dehydrogenase, cytochrome b556 subunit [Paracoccus sp. IB05]
MSAPKRVERPLSPFMIGPYYRPQMTSISSIMVRITGIATLGTIFLIVAWLVAAVTSPAAFDCVNGLLTSVTGDIIMTLAAWAIWYHALGRLRHVIWDLGYFIEVKANEIMGWGMFLGATILTVITVLVV